MRLRTSTLLLAGTLLLLAATGDAASNRAPPAEGDDFELSWSPSAGQITFFRVPAGGEETHTGTLNVMNADGTRQVQLLRTTNDVNTVLWAPRGDLIAYEEGSGEVYVIHADGSGRRDLTNGRDLTWAPSGTKIALDDGGGSTSAISVADVDGTGLTQITHGYIDRQPAWSPDGARLVFVRAAANTNDPSFIYVMNADGSHSTRISSVPGASPQWSPDGKHIAFTGDGIYVVQPDGNGQARLARPAGSRLSWSPDGSRIAFARIGSLWAVEVDGSKQIELAPFDEEILFGATPVWSPDGTRIGIAENRGCRHIGIELVAADGSGHTRVTQRCSILKGTGRRNVLVGGRGSDSLLGLGGNDKLVGRGGDDLLDGGPGADSLSGGAGSDRLAGGSGRDVLNGGPGADYLFGDAGVDAIIGGAGADHLFGDAGADAIIGGAGADQIESDGDHARDVIKCGPGRDDVSADKLDKVARDCESVIRFKS